MKPGMRRFMGEVAWGTGGFGPGPDDSKRKPSHLYCPQTTRAATVTSIQFSFGRRPLRLHVRMRVTICIRKWTAGVFFCKADVPEVPPSVGDGCVEQSLLVVILGPKQYFRRACGRSIIGATGDGTEVQKTGRPNWLLQPNRHASGVTGCTVAVGAVSSKAPHQTSHSCQKMREEGLACSPSYGKGYSLGPGHQWAARGGVADGGMWQSALNFPRSHVYMAVAGEAGAFILAPSSGSPSFTHPKTRHRWKTSEDPLELPPPLSLHRLHSRKSHEARFAGRSDPQRRLILLLPLPRNKNVPKPKNLSRKPTVTRSQMVLAANQAGN